ncbi:retrovirus-related pol polyprotein from transposon TNT 1-94, partial [Tanacetum coccineum]
AERRNRTLIEAARTMLADSKFPTTFWAEAVNTACYVQNKVLVVKPHNKTPYELFYGRTLTLSFMRPFKCPVTILNTIDHLGKYDGKVDEGFFVGYSLNSKAFRVFNSRTRIVEENFHIRFSKSTPNVVGSGPDWLFDIDALTRTMNYESIVACTLSNGFVGTKVCDNAGQARKETELVKNYILLPLWHTDPRYSQYQKCSQDDGSKPSSDDGKKVDEDSRKDSEVNVVCGKTSIKLPLDPNMPELEDYSIFDSSRNDEDVGAEADMHNLDTAIQFSPIPTTGIHKDHPLDQLIGDFQSAIQTRKMSKILEEHGMNPKRSMIRSLMYLTSSRPDIMFAVCVCARYQVNPKVSHLHYVKRIFRYLKGQPKLGLWYRKDSPFDLVAYTDSDYARARFDRKSTTGVDGKKIIITESTVRRDLQLEDAEGVDCLPNAIIFEQLALMGISEIGEGSANPTDPHHTPTIIQPSPQPQKKQKPRKTKKKDTQIPQSSGPTEHLADEVVHKERVTVWFENVSKLSNDPLLARGNTLQNGEDSLKLNELMKLCTNLQQRVLDLETTKTTQANEIASLKRKVKRLKKKKRSRTHGLKRLYKVGLSARVESSRDEENLGEDASKQGRINAIDADEDITLVNDQDDVNMFDVNTLAGEKVFVAEQSGNIVEEVVVVIDVASKILVSAAIITDVEVTLAQAMVELKSAKPKADKVVIQEPEQEERLAREKAQQIEEANIAWDDVQAKVEVDYQLAHRLQCKIRKAREVLTDEEKARIFVNTILIAKNRKIALH